MAVLTGADARMGVPEPVASWVFCGPDANGSLKGVTNAVLAVPLLGLGVPPKPIRLRPPAGVLILTGLAFGMDSTAPVSLNVLVVDRNGVRDTAEMVDWEDRGAGELNGDRPAVDVEREGLLWSLSSPKMAKARVRLALPAASVVSPPCVNVVVVEGFVELKSLSANKNKTEARAASEGGDTLPPEPVVNIDVVERISVAVGRS